MFKKVWTIFLRDLKVNIKDFLSLYILFIPLLFAIGINLFTPSINDTTVNLALIKGENNQLATYMEQFAKVEEFDNLEALKERVEGRDSMIGIVPEEGQYYIMIEGNESDMDIEYSKILLGLYETGLNIEDSKTEIIEFGRTVPPIKKTLVNTSILFISILAGMLISLNIVEEKVDNTISAINLTPTSHNSFLLGKSIIGIIFAILGGLALVYIAGFGDVDIEKILLIISVLTILSILVGFIQGLINDDIMTAAASIKLLFLPLIAGVLAVEILSGKWQRILYWNPFYWAYKGNDLVLSKNGSWGQILIYAGIVLFLSGIVYVFLAPKIRKGLE